MPPRPRLTLLDYGHRAIVSTCIATSAYGLWAIWRIHNANISAGAEYMRVLKIEQERAISEGREPPEKLDQPASFYLNNPIYKDNSSTGNESNQTSEFLESK